jgi:ABC-type sugar transport system ATPase subunit
MGKIGVQEDHKELISDNNYPVLEVKHISKKFPGVTALDDVDLAVQRGEKS